MKWLPLIRTALFATVAAAAALIVGASGSYWYASKSDRLMSYPAPGYVTDPQGFMRATYKAGDAILLNVTSRRQPGECWAEYVTVFDGPITYQSPSRRSQLFSDHVVVVDLHMFLILPEQLPTGRYTVSQVVYPTCSGVALRPFKPDMHNLAIDIVGR